MQSENNKIGVGFGVMLLKENKLLLGQRHSDPSKADSELHGEGTWTMPGGKMQFGESFEECGARELKEETGIDGKNFQVISIANDKVPDAHFITIGLLCNDFDGDARVLEPDEITKWEWFPLDKLPFPLFFPSKNIIDNYLAGKVYQKIT